MKEKDILHQKREYWVFRDKHGCHVMQSGATHATSVSTFAPNDDGLSLAIAYCNYIATGSTKGESDYP